MKGIYWLLASVLVLAITLPLAFSDSAITIVTVGNSAPGVDNIIIAGSDTGASVSPNAGSTRTVSLSVQATDVNGWSDISSIICTIGGAGTVEASPVTLSLVMLDTDSVTGTGSFDMDFYDASGTYTVSCEAKDANLHIGTRAEDFTYTTATALELDTTSIEFGLMSAGGTSTVTGDNSMTTSAAPTIQNIGNVLIDATISGTDLISSSNASNIITVGNMEYKFDTLAFHALSTSTQTELGLDLAYGSSSTTNVDFRLTVPIGIVTGVYQGEIIVSAVAG